MKLLIFMLLFVNFACARGPVGPQGPAGQDGQDITPLNMVQFCQSCQGQYPNVFPEVGFCVNGTLYATYSANGGFSAEIPPGNYQSNGVGCSCNFTVLDNCQIQN